MPPKQDPFLQKKQSILSSNIDLSPKGSIDQLCIPIIKLINDNSNDMVTTSSCSGRLSVFVEGVKEKSKKDSGDHELKDPENELQYKLGGKGDGGEWLFITHDVNEVENWLSKIDTAHTVNISPKESLDTENTLDMTQERLILYKFEPLILHVKCRDFESASKLYNVAMSCGFRESGIGSNFNVAIRINIKLDVPIGYLKETYCESTGDKKSSLEIIVNDFFLKNVLDPLTILKFKENEIKLKELYEKINTDIILKQNDSNNAVESENGKNSKETKEERRERKKKEGLAKQLEMLKLKNQEESTVAV